MLLRSGKLIPTSKHANILISGKAGVGNYIRTLRALTTGKTSKYGGAYGARLLFAANKNSAEKASQVIERLIDKLTKGPDKKLSQNDRDIFDLARGEEVGRLVIKLINLWSAQKMGPSTPFGRGFVVGLGKEQKNELIEYLAKLISKRAGLANHGKVYNIMRLSIKSNKNARNGERFATNLHELYKNLPRKTDGSSAPNPFLQGVINTALKRQSAINQNTVVVAREIIKKAAALSNANKNKLKMGASIAASARNPVALVEKSLNAAYKLKYKNGPGNPTVAKIIQAYKNSMHDLSLSLFPMSTAGTNVLKLAYRTAIPRAAEYIRSKQQA